MHARRRGIFLAISCFFGLADDLWFFVLCQGERVTVAVVGSSCLGTATGCCNCWFCFFLLVAVVSVFRGGLISRLLLPAPAGVVV